MKGSDGSWSDDMETQFGHIEDKAARVVRAVVDDQTWPIPDEQRAILATWAALQHLRTTGKRSVSNEVADAAFKMQIAIGGKDDIRRMLVKGAEGRTPSEKEVEESWAMLTAFDDYTVKPGNNVHLSTIQGLLERATEEFYDRGWTLVRFTRKALITSDSPVVLVRDPDSEAWRGVGLATAGGVLLPLDRRVGLFMTRTGDPDNVLPGTTAWAREFNQQLALAARRALFHHPDDTPLEGIELPEPRDHELVVDSLNKLLGHVRREE